MEVFVARFPIFDKQKNVNAFELKFREGFEPYYKSLSEDRAVVDLEAMVSFDELTGGKRGLVNFTPELLQADFLSVLPKDSVIIGLPPELRPTERNLAACKRLAQSGCVMAIDLEDVEQERAAFLESCAVARIDSQDVAPEKIESLCKELNNQKVATIVRGLDSSSQFEQVLAFGANYFQGNFFCKPVEHPEKKIPSNKLNRIQLLNEISKPELSYDDIADVIKRDVSMTFTLLKLINSVCFGLRYEVTSIRHALVLLGPEEVRKWATVYTVRDFGEDKPGELILRSLIRARVSEQIAQHLGKEKRAPEFFLMGMLSFIDALTDMPMSEALEILPVSTDIRTALLGGVGPFREVLDTVIAYELGDWESLSIHAANLPVDERVIPEMFRSATQWGHEAIGAMQ